METDSHGSGVSLSSWHPAHRPDTSTGQETLASTDEIHSITEAESYNDQPSSTSPLNSQMPSVERGDGNSIPQAQFLNQSEGIGDGIPLPMHKVQSMARFEGNAAGDIQNVDPLEESPLEIQEDIKNSSSAWPHESSEAQGEATFEEESLRDIDGLPLPQDGDRSYFGYRGANPGTTETGNTNQAGVDDGDGYEAELSESQEDKYYSKDIQGKTSLEDWPESEFDLNSQTKFSVQNHEGFTEDKLSPTLNDNAIITAERKGNDMTQKSNEDDLAALWKAALEDDEFADGADAVDPTAFFDNDGEGFLNDEEDAVAQHGSEMVDQRGSTSDFNEAMNGPGGTTHNAQPFIQSNLTKDLGGSGIPNHRSDLQSPQLSYHSAAGRQGYPPRPTQTSSTQSFVDKSKGGYSSPYDLPMDIAKPRKRSAAQPLSSTPNHPIAPPVRSSSMYSGALPVQSPPPASNSGIPPLSSSPQSSQTMQPLPASHPENGPSSQPSSRKSSSDFFAELPHTTKPRLSTAQSKYGPQGSASVMPPRPSLSSTPLLPEQRRVSEPSSISLASQLRPPERLPPFPEHGTPQRATPQAPVTSSRYSPAPASVPPAKGHRYSPAPPSQPVTASFQTRHTMTTGPPASQALPYAPRTSSPLAHQSTVPQPPGGTPLSQNQSLANTSLSSGQSAPEPHHFLEDVKAEQAGPPRRPTNLTMQANETISETMKTLNPYQPDALRTTPPPSSRPPSMVGSPQRRFQPEQGVLHASQSQASELPYSPPRRSRTQSPSVAAKAVPKVLSSLERYSPVTQPSIGEVNTVQNAGAILGHRRTVTRDLNFIKPEGGHALDPLERWKGSPLFTWGLGGSVLFTFPKQVPRYGSGSSIPMIKCSPGEISIQNARSVCPLPEAVSRFPGPLKGKSKKKDVSAWLSANIQNLHQEIQSQVTDRQHAQEPSKRLEEKALLWSVVRLLVDHDGILNGNPNVEKAVKDLLSTQTSSAESSAAFPSNASVPQGSGFLDGSSVPPESSDHHILDAIRSSLMQGDREKAVWRAADQRLWGHAILIASTLSKEIWKQVVQEFVRQEVKKVGGRNESLAALYQIFAGNWEESIDELVPLSARAGFQMVSLDESGLSKTNSLEGLDRWLETLCIILNNRSPDDSKALVALGKLLAGYGRVEAAHICYLFAGSMSYFGGADDPLSNVVLLGADHVHHPLDFDRDLESILLTEVYEYALSLQSNSSSAPMPHLLGFKLHYAVCLAEYGFRAEAQQYCDAITASMKSTVRPSPYHHSNLVSQLDDLSRRLSQSPRDGSSSWISKPSMEKVSGSMWAKFNSFVAGEEGGPGNKASEQVAGTDPGPFAKLAGTPTLSPTTTDPSMFGPYAVGGSQPVQPMSLANSRYAPLSATTQQAQVDQSPVGVSQTQRDPLNAPSGSPMNSGPNLYSPQYGTDNHTRQVDSNPASTNPMFGWTSGLDQAFHAQNDDNRPGYGAEAMPISSASYSQSSQVDSNQGNPAYSSLPDGSAYSRFSESQATQMNSSYQRGFEGTMSRPESLTQYNQYEAGGAGQDLTSSYEPPTTSYEAPSYEPYASEVATENGSARNMATKKDFFMDDDDDRELDQRAAELKAQQKARADKEADEAFKKAAEADAAKAAQAAGEKKGWFGGWFKRDANATPGPIKAKLGEENSFVYDPELKKWVNKKGGPSSNTPTATPPPPKGPPSRPASAASHSSSGPPPSAPPTRTPMTGSEEPQSQQSGLATPARSMSPARASEGVIEDSPRLIVPSGGPPSRPQSRPATALSAASSIDDLIGAAGARKGGTVKKGKKGRGYVDVMAAK